jgi:DNA topoisomerase-2
MKKKSPKKKVDSDDDNDSPPAPARITAKRPARTAPKKYMEILSEDDDSGDKDESMFDDD